MQNWYGDWVGGYGASEAPIQPETRCAKKMVPDLVAFTEPIGMTELSVLIFVEHYGVCLSVAKSDAFDFWMPSPNR